MYGHERSLVNSMKGRPFALLGVNTDKSLDVAKSAVKDNELNWRSWFDGSGGDIVRKFKIRSFPTILVLDHTGVIRFKNIRGASLDAAIEQLVQDAENAGMSGEPVDTSNYRVFKTADGKHEVEAAYVKYEGGNAFLKRKDNKKIVEIPLKILSKEDKEFVRGILRANK